jgi:hypothetical protein
MNSDIYRRDQAERYAPKTPEEGAAAARDLASSGYTDSTIGAVLKLDVNAVRQMLGDRSRAVCAN